MTALDVAAALMFLAAIAVVLLGGIRIGMAIYNGDKTGRRICRDNAVASEADRAEHDIYARWLL